MKKKSVGIISGIFGAVIGGITIASCLLSRKKTSNNDKFKIYYNTLNQWIKIRNKGIRLQQFFDERGYKEIAIYGMGELGNRLYEELENSDIKVLYGIDKSAQSIFSDLEVKSLDDDLDEVDVVVVTAVFAYEQIKEEISDRFSCKVISLEDVVFEL